MIVIGVPVGKSHQIDVRTAAYCSAEAVFPHVKWGYCSSKECGVGRSMFVYTALMNPNVTHVLNIDSDVVPPLGTLQKLCDYDLPIVAGIYPTVTKGKKTWSFKMDDDIRWRLRGELPESLTEVTAIGGSTVLIKREVFEKMERPWFRASYNELGDYAEKEDEYFSRTARAAGYKLFIDPSIVCKHFNYGEI
jgi:hypothetical protein